LTGLHKDNGVELLTEAAVEKIEKSGDVTLVRLADGRTVEAASVVVGIGAQPNTEWLDDSGLKIADGVWVDAGCAVLANGFGPHAEGVYAIGDVARQVNPATNKDYRVEHWTNAVEQAHVVARQIVDPTAAPEPLKAPYFWSDQFDLKMVIVGLAAGHDQVVVRGDPASRAFSVCYLRGGELVAVETVNHIKDQMGARKLIPARARPDPVKLADDSIALKDTM